MDAPLQPERIQRILARIRSRCRPATAGARPTYTGEEFEADLYALLSELLPFSVLPGVRLFDPSHASSSNFGHEIDALFHIRFRGTDWIVIVEAKHQPIRLQDGGWLVAYSKKTKNVLEQIDKHVRTLWSYLDPAPLGRELKFVAFVVSSDSDTPERTESLYRNSEAFLTSIQKLPALIQERFNLVRHPGKPQPELLRVAQSEYLDLLRLSLPRPELGHPEYASALRYVERCRHSLDDTRFAEFNPTPERWMINGSAGTGKSVLLAYSAAVLSTGYTLVRSEDQVFAKSYAEELKCLGFEPTKGTIAIFAMSSKQLDPNVS